MGYLNSIKAGALETWKVYKILPSVVGAQGALESGWGTSRLAKPPYNNQFGIKPGGDWTGKTITMPTREYVNGVWRTENEPFRWYDDPGESIRDHGAFFTSTEWRRNNYKAVVGETDYKKACWALQNAPAPYATDPGYAQKLINLIETHNLQAWDREAMAGNSNTVATQTQQTVVSKIVGRELSSAGRTYVKDLNVTMIGDSLGVGTKPHFESLVPKANYDVLGSRQITHATNSLNGTYILQQLKNAGNLKEYVVVILGTNRGVTEQEINNFVNIAGSDRKVIFVDTASEVGHSNTVSVHYENSAKRLSNVYYANWKSTAIPLRPQYYSRDGANGEYIHMTPTGYRKHAEFIAQALYEVATTNFTDRAAETTKTEFYDIKDLELNEDGLITYDVLESNSDGTSTKKKATKQTNIKGLYSPYGDSSIYNPKANRMYGFGSSVNNSNWRESYFEDNEIEDSVRLLEMASAELLERQEPEMIYTVNLLEIPVELSIGDTGIFVDHEFSPPLYLQARVLSLTTSETNPSLNRVTIGNVTELEPQDKSALMALRAELQETRKDLESNWIGSISTNMTVVSTNGYVLGDRTRETSLVARVLKGKEDITNQYDKFTWERISEDGSKDSVYNDSLANSVQSSVLTVYEADIIGNQSKFVARAFNAKNELVSHQEIVLKRVETAIWVDTDTPPAYATDGSTWVNQDGEQYVKVDGEWEKRVDQAKIFTVEQDISEAKDIAESAKQEADDAYARADKALEEAGFSKKLAEESNELALELHDNLTDVSGMANNALSEANQAKSEAEQALAELLNKVNQFVYDTKVQEIDGAISGHGTRISDNEEQIELRAYKTEVDPLKTRLTTAEASIGANATEISLRAKQTEVDSIEGRLSTAEGELTTQAGIISLKVSQTDFNSLTGRVSTAEGQITTQANLISQRLTSQQVDNLVNAKGYATQTWATSQINSTATSINQRISSVEGQLSLNLLDLTRLANESRPNPNNMTTSYLLYKGKPNTKYTLSTNIPVRLGPTYDLFIDAPTFDPASTKNGVGLNNPRTITTDGTGNMWIGFRPDDNPEHYTRLRDILSNEYWVILVEGSVAQSYSDNTIVTKINDLNQTVDGWMSTISYVDNNRTQINQTISTVNSWESTIAYVKNNQSKLNETISNVDSWKNTISYVQNNQSKINQTMSTVDGWTTTIAYVNNNQTKINQTISTVDGYRQVLGSNGEKITQLVMTDSVFMTAIDEVKRAKQLLDNGNFTRGTDRWILDGSGTIRLLGNQLQMDYANISGKTRIYNNSFPVIPGTTYTIKIRARTLSAATIEVGFFEETVDIELSTEFKTYTVSVMHPTAGYAISIYKLNSAGSVIIDSVELYEEGGVTTSQVTQLANNWAVRMLNSKNDIVSQINLSDSTFLIEAKNIVGLGNAVINGKLTVTEDMIAGAISADKIRGGTISGTTFRTDDTASGFRMTLHGGRLDFMHGNTTLGSLYSTLDSQTNVVNGVANVQTPGYIYSINSRSSSSSQSRPVIQIPENSSMESMKLNIWAQGGFRVESDTLIIDSDHVRTLRPFVAGDGFRASHQQSSAGASIANAGHLIYSVDADSNGVLIHRLQPRPKGGSIRNSGIAIYEDGRVAVVKNGVWTQL